MTNSLTHRYTISTANSQTVTTASTRHNNILSLKCDFLHYRLFKFFESFFHLPSSLSAVFTILVDFICVFYVRIVRFQFLARGIQHALLHI